MANTRIYWLHTLSPTHVGTGRGLGYIDLPIHRDKVTHWPIVPASAFKGVWADRFRATDERRRASDKLRLAFGIASDSNQGNSNAGALVPTDARIVCLPVRSFQGTFAWCTSSLALRMLRRDLMLAGLENLPPDPVAPIATQAFHATLTALKEGSKIYLEDLDFDAAPHAAAAAWASRIAGWVFPGDSTWQSEFQRRFVIVPDTVFDFQTETGTEVAARVKIDDELKTVKDGQLWTEESLPAETIMAGLVFCERVYAARSNGITEQSLLNEFASTQAPLTLQIGGKATVGRGRVRCVFSELNGGAR
jgi:CRISPR-associated protein Cmr4